MTSEEDLPRIPEFYSGRSLFITGFTGFMGKVLVEKLLWSCPDVKAIYVLLRSKRGRSPQERIDKIIKSEHFQSRLYGREDLYSKIIPLDGDVTLPELGLTKEQTVKLQEEVSIVFHCAASVRFDDPLTVALDINAKGTKSVVDLALGMDKIVAFVHVSTAYANCDRFEIEEKLYPPHADWRDSLIIREKIDEGTLNTLSKKYTNFMPNTYVFAKSLGEHIVSDHSDRLPVVVFRPSIVISTMFEPFPGLIDNLNGPVGLLVGFGAGVTRTCILNDEIQPDFVPVDIAIRGMIISAYARVYKKVDGMHYYNWCTRDRSVSYKELIEMGKKILVEAPMKLKLWHPTTHTTSSYTSFYINFVLFHVITAFFIDLILKVVGQKPILWKLQRRIFIAMDALSYFTLNNFTFHNKHAYDLEDYIQPSDKQEFHFLLKPDEVDEYALFYNGCRYFQKRFLKMKPEDINTAQKLSVIFQFADWIVKTAFWLSVIWLVYTYQIIPTILHHTYTFLIDF